MKRILIVILLLMGYTVAGQPVTVLSLGFGKDLISGQPLINANFIVKNAYASYSISIDNRVKSYDVGWTFKFDHFYFAPTLGVSCVNDVNTKRYYLQTVTDNDITITEIQVSLDGKPPVIISGDPPIVSTGTGSTVVSVIDRVDTNNRNYPNIGIFAGYQFHDGLMVFIKGTNNSIGCGIGFSIN